MSQFAINVGLNVKGSANTEREILARAQIAHLAIGGFISWRGSYSSEVDIRQSNSEPTLVMTGYISRISMETLKDFLYTLAVALGQDCIAVAEVKDNGDLGNGWLVGPHAKAWGSFDPKFFIA